MKKWSCSFLVASFLFAACQDDGLFDSYQKEENQLIPQAREFYEKVISDAAANGTLVQDRNMSPGEVTPRWHEAYLKQDSKYEYVYVPIHAEKNYIRQVEMKKNGQKKTYNVYLSQTLCVRKDREGKYSAAYITMMPTLSHYKRNKNQFTEKVIKSETLYGDFSGYVAYNNIVTSGLMVVDKVDKGKFQWALSRETPLEKDSIWTLYKEIYKNIHSLNMSLTRHTIDGGSLEEVVITPDDGTYYCLFCRANMPYDHVCSDNNDSNKPGPWDGDNDNGLDVGGDSGSGSGGGGSSWGGSNSSNNVPPINDNPSSPQQSEKLPKTDFREYSKVYVPSSTDKFPNNTDRFKWDKKCYIQGDEPYCVGYSMNYLNRQLNNDNTIKPKDFIKNYKIYEQEHGKNSTESKGYDMSLVEGYIGEYFTVHEFTDFSSAINNGQVVLTWIKLPNGESHSIVVVGVSQYGGNDNLLYMDSNYGELRMIDQNDIEMYLYRAALSGK